MAPPSNMPPARQRTALIILALLLILAVIVLGANHLVHRAAAQQVEATLQAWQDQDTDTPGLHLRWADYDRATGELQYRLRYIPEAHGPVRELLADLQDTRTPRLETSGTAQVTTRGLAGLLGTIARVEGGLTLSDTWRSILPDFEDDDWLRYQVDVHTRGRHQAALSGIAYAGRILDAQGERTGEASWRTWSLHARLANEDRLAHLEASLPRLWLREQDGELDALLEDLNLWLEDAMLDGGLLIVGDSRLSLGHLSVEEPEGTLSLKQLAMNWNNHRDGDRFRDRVAFSLGRVSLNGERVVDQAQLQLSSDLGYEALRDLAALANNLDPEADLTRQDEERLERAVTALLRQGGEIILEQASVARDDTGALSGQVSLGLREDPDFELDGELQQLHNLYGGLRLTFDEPLVQSIMERSLRAQWPHVSEAHLAQMVEQQWREWSVILGMMPFVTEWEDQRVTLALELEDGVLKVEGRQVMNLRDLMGMF
ncbi:hypothetical protein M911_09525 [Ectothiorhodospira haloalkaliphila]|uniref:DUF945 domain-containing protein n=1 Tax=Ectothiorhodospira haloalkaliphila TaxID=421628 RepID=W8KLQ6_9GAMM|nr:DUF945 family protein [Ectothiorhodospira haloalkaliphila]AHK80704.1 hypothetical protein M911_09525 [Ectothiorhodospira haloalkaliphila]